MDRLGFQSINTTPNGLLWALHASHVKGLNNLDVLKAAPDNAIRLFRAVEDNEDVSQPERKRDAIVNALKGYRHPLLHVEGWNEKHPTPRQMRVLVDLLHAEGLKVSGPCWASGDYTLDDWQAFRNDGWCGLDRINLHGYFSRAVGPTPWNAYRHRSLYVAALDRNLPLDISETGEDTVRDGPMGTYVGLPGYQANHTTTDQYIDELLTIADGALPYEHWYAFAVGCPNFPDFELESIIPTLLPKLYQGAPSVTETPAPAVHSGSLKYARLVDVSNNNGPIDVALLARCVDGAIFKCGEGTTFTDKYFAGNWRDAQTNHLPRAAYQFCRPSQNSGRAEAQFMLDTVHPVKGDVAILDIEDTNVGGTADLLAYLLDAITTLEASWVTPIIYSSDWYLQPHNLEGPHAQALARCGLYYASYTPAPPIVPAPWSFWALWQYTANGVVPGVHGAVDMDLFNGSIEQFLRYGKAS